ncbi:MAG: type I DNA topoisomerase [Francisellaceae bacterium]|nr:type I DNA topoisomerase [Francisellaceae bacterium]
MAKHLLIVESPAKAKTLKKYLGDDFTILASYGHVRDLIPKEGAVKPDEDFAMTYALIDKNSKHVDKICKELKDADDLYLATDPDREGEAISWHLHEIIKSKRGLKNKPMYRVAFYEITKKAVQEAVANPRELAIDLIHAQQARRALDYLVGFNLSPLLWKKIRRGLSAGRVQSPALRLIAERELDIEKFISQEYWTIAAKLEKEESEFKAKLTHYQSDKLTQFSITKENEASSAKTALEDAAQGKLIVEKVVKSQRRRNPVAPFITSTLQQEAVKKLGFTTQRTMKIAQQLYEGIDVGGGAVGLISYMRTDSVNLAAEAIDEIRELIEKRYGKEFLPDSPKEYKTKAKNAQEAHEAIRPTSVMRTPTIVKEHLNDEQFKLYQLIWQRTVACQMVAAIFDQVSIDFSCGGAGMFRATGSVLKAAGYMQVYHEVKDDGQDEEKDNFLPDFSEGDVVALKDILTEQHFTEPPPRYSEATLVKALEEHGIGRPSTYAAIISTLKNREYVEIITKRFHPTDVGRIVSKFLTNYFHQYVDYEFTAHLEDELDAIARGEKEWKPLLEEFWRPFISQIKEIEESVSRSDVTQEKIDERCPECQGELSIRLGKRGRFIGCVSYPDCKYTRSLNPDAEGAQEGSEPEVVPDKKCPKCEEDLIYRFGKYGKFIGCSGYPKCKFIESLNKPEDTDVQCPTCKKENLFKRRSRYGTFFYACNGYPTCKYSVKHEPINTPCPDCSWPITTLKETKSRGKEKVCPQKECSYCEQIDSEEE